MVKYGHTHSSVNRIISGCFCVTRAELRGCDRKRSLQSQRYLLFDPLQKKFANPWFKPYFSVINIGGK